MAANKTFWSVCKVEVVSFKLSRKPTDVPLKLKLNGIFDIAIKLNMANAILSKLKHFIDRKLWNQFVMQYSNLIYNIPHLFGHKI